MYTEQWTWHDEEGALFISNSNDKPNINAVKVIKCTQSFLQKWLREEHKISVCCYVEDINKERCCYWVAVHTAKKATQKGFVGFKTVFETNIGNNMSYEQALEKGLTKALELIP